MPVGDRWPSTAAGRCVFTLLLWPFRYISIILDLCRLMKWLLRDGRPSICGPVVSFPLGRLQPDPWYPVVILMWGNSFRTRNQRLLFAVRSPKLEERDLYRCSQHVFVEVLCMPSACPWLTSLYAFEHERKTTIQKQNEKEMGWGAHSRNLQHQSRIAVHRRKPNRRFHFWTWCRSTCRDQPPNCQQKVQTWGKAMQSSTRKKDVFVFWSKAFGSGVGCFFAEISEIMCSRSSGAVQKQQSFLTSQRLTSSLRRLAPKLPLQLLNGFANLAPLQLGIGIP